MAVMLSECERRRYAPPGWHRRFISTPQAVLPTAPALARGWVLEQTWAWGLGEISEDAQTVVSELVTNVLDQANKVQSLEQEVFQLGLYSTLTDLLIEVYDHLDGWPEIRVPDWEKESGRGLFIIGNLTGGRWGCRRYLDGKIVWAALGGH